MRYHRDLDSILVVRQWRPAVWACAGGEAPLAEGVTLELCAGVLDKPELTPAEVAAAYVVKTDESTIA